MAARAVSSPRHREGAREHTDGAGRHRARLRAEAARARRGSAVEYEAILYDEGEGTLHKLNATAAALSALFDGEVALGALMDDLVSVFEGDRAMIEADALAMTRELARQGLLEGVGEGEAVPADGAEDALKTASPDAASDA